MSAIYPLDISKTLLEMFPNETGTAERDGVFAQ
jgi:hypothetical protein